MFRRIFFLIEAKVTENIAFGIDPDKIDAEQIERCARLSGGQRQRIGIARALYHDSDILVFNEATSALDTVTKRAVIEAIDALHPQKTIILIAHRLFTVAGCDQMVLFEHGKVEAKGTFESIKDCSTRFRTMAVGQ